MRNGLGQEEEGMSDPSVSLGSEWVFSMWHEEQAGMDPASGKYLRDRT